MSRWDRDLKQKAVYYAASQNHRTREGTIRVLAGVEIKCNYNSLRKEINDPQGNVIVATVHMAVDRSVLVHSIIWLGALRNIPSPVTNLYEVVNYNEVMDVRRRETRREVLLTPFSDTLPEITTVA